MLKTSCQISVIIKVLYLKWTGSVLYQVRVSGTSASLTFAQACFSSVWDVGMGYFRAGKRYIHVFSCLDPQCTVVKTGWHQPSNLLFWQLVSILPLVLDTWRVEGSFSWWGHELIECSLPQMNCGIHHTGSFQAFPLYELFKALLSWYSFLLVIGHLRSLRETCFKLL